MSYFFFGAGLRLFCGTGSKISLLVGASGPEGAATCTGTPHFSKVMLEITVFPIDAT